MVKLIYKLYIYIMIHVLVDTKILWTSEMIKSANSCNNRVMEYS